MPAPPSNDQPDPDPSRPYAEEEISLLDILVVLARNRRFIIACVIGAALFGVVYALAASEEYTASTQVVREAEGSAGQNIPGGLSALRGLGISVGGGASGLTPEAYPNIVSSREVRLAVARDTFYFPELEQQMSFVDYYEQQEAGLFSTLRRYTIGLPGQIIGWFSSDDEVTRPIETDEGERIYPTEAEEDAIRAIGNKVSSSADIETGIMSISVTDEDAVRASEVAETFLDHLRERVRTMRTEKARQTLEFIDERFQEAREELQQAEEQLAVFNDRNRDIRSARLRTEQERLQRQVRFASDLFSELQAQRTQAEIALQRSQSVITVLEAPSPPSQRSAPRRTLIVLLSLILGGMVGVGGAFVKTFLGEQEDQEERAKLDEIKHALRHPFGRSSTLDTTQ